MGTSKYYNNLSSRGVEILDNYFSIYFLNVGYFNISVIKVIILIIIYLFFNLFLFKKNNDVISHLSKKLVFLSGDLIESEKKNCDRFCTILSLLLLLLYFITFFILSPSAYLFFLILLFNLIYFVPYRTFLLIFAIIIFFISTFRNIIYFYGTDLNNEFENIYKVDRSSLNEEVAEFFKKKNFNNFYVIGGDARFEQNALAYSDINNDYIFIGEYFYKNQEVHYTLIHEYGHIYHKHTCKMDILFFILVFLLGMGILGISNYLVQRQNYRGINKKLLFSIYFFTFLIIIIPTYLKLIFNILSVRMEWEADNYCITKGFAYKVTKYYFINYISKNKKLNYDNWTVGIIQVYLENTHPTNFMRVLNFARSL